MEQSLFLGVYDPVRDRGVDRSSSNLDVDGLDMEPNVTFSEVDVDEYNPDVVVRVDSDTSRGVDEVI